MANRKEIAAEEMEDLEQGIVVDGNEAKGKLPSWNNVSLPYSHLIGAVTDIGILAWPKGQFHRAKHGLSQTLIQQAIKTRTR